jgi:hypothetical protein
MTVHWPSRYWFLPLWPHFLLLWLPEVIVWGSGLELRCLPVLPLCRLGVGVGVYSFLSEPPTQIIGFS